VDLKVLARGTPGFSGADLANLVNEAALLAARHSKKLVEMFDFESAKDKVLMGVERRSMIISEERSGRSPITRRGTRWSRTPCPAPTPSTSHDHPARAARWGSPSSCPRTTSTTTRATTS
jgi:hypothetical protein